MAHYDGDEGWHAEPISQVNDFDFTDCCDVWRQIKPAFGWFRLTDGDADVRIMPYINSDHREKWRVNHCPSCGAERRKAAMRIEEQNP